MLQSPSAQPSPFPCFWTKFWEEATPTMVRLVEKFLNSCLSGQQEVRQGLARRTLF